MGVFRGLIESPPFLCRSEAFINEQTKWHVQFLVERAELIRLGQLNIWRDMLLQRMEASSRWCTAAKLRLSCEELHIPVVYSITDFVSTLIGVICAHTGLSPPNEPTRTRSATACWGGGGEVKVGGGGGICQATIVGESRKRQCKEKPL